VPLALLSREADGPIRIDVDDHGAPRSVRRVLPPPAAYLTHVTWASWEHGADIAVQDLAAANGELRLRFDRDLADGVEGRTGVNVHTFFVETEDSQGDRARLPSDPDNPPRVENGCEAVFTIAPGQVRSPKRTVAPLVGDTVFVTVLGDLIHDCNGLPVDADFFGSFPSGDGVQGGVLRSWFTVGNRQETAP
jgi:hypothetical protein